MLSRFDETLGLRRHDDEGDRAMTSPAATEEIFDRTRSRPRPRRLSEGCIGWRDARVSSIRERYAFESWAWVSYWNGWPSEGGCEAWRSRPVAVRQSSTDATPRRGL